MPPGSHSSCGAYPQSPAAAWGVAAGGLGQNDCTPSTTRLHLQVLNV